MKKAKVKKDCKFLNNKQECKILNDTYCEYQDECAFYKTKGDGTGAENIYDSE